MTTKMSVLIVEDDALQRAAMCLTLDAQDITVSEAATVADGLARYHEQAPDVVIIDLHLPDGTGYDLAMWLWRKRPQLPLVIISVDFCDKGCPPPRPRKDRSLVLLPKPFSPEQLFDAISKVVKPPAMKIPQ